MKNIEQSIFAISMICFLASIIFLLISLIKYGFEEGFSIKKHLVKISFGLFSCYGIFTIILIILID